MGWLVGGRQWVVLVFVFIFVFAFVYVFVFGYINMYMTASPGACDTLMNVVSLH